MGVSAPCHSAHISGQGARGRLWTKAGSHPTSVRGPARGLGHWDAWCGAALWPQLARHRGAPMVGKGSVALAAWAARPDAWLQVGPSVDGLLAPSGALSEVPPDPHICAWRRGVRRTHLTVEEAVEHGYHQALQGEGPEGPSAAPAHSPRTRT